jgi:hypothetical protein
MTANKPVERMAAKKGQSRTTAYTARVAGRNKRAKCGTDPFMKEILAR